MNLTLEAIQSVIDGWFRFVFPRPVLANRDDQRLANVCNNIHGICVALLSAWAVAQSAMGFHNGQASRVILLLFILQLIVFRQLLQRGYVRSVVLIESLAVVALSTASSYFLGSSRNAQVLALSVGIMYSTFLLGGWYGLFILLIGAAGIAWIAFLEVTRVITSPLIQPLPQAMTAIIILLIAWIIATLIGRARVRSYKIAKQERDFTNTQLEELNQTLEVTVESRTAELELAIAELNAAKEAMVRSETLAGLGGLVAGVSHEMATPIGNALLVATSLKEKAKNLDLVRPDDQAAAIQKFIKTAMTSTDIIVRNLERLESLVRNFKNVSVDQTSMRKRTFELSEIIKQVRGALSPSTDDKQIAFVCDFEPGIQISGYPGALEHVIINLVNNSIKHAFEEGHTGPREISIRTIRTQKGADIIFADNGCGMDEDTLKHAFDPFFTTKMGQGGTGIGLTLVHRMVCEVMSGQIDIESVRGSGVRFRIAIPLIAKTAIMVERRKVERGPLSEHQNINWRIRTD